MLDLHRITAGYGGARAIEEVILRLASGAALAILGRNGAGKSTTLKTIMGLLTPWSGRIEFDGNEITSARPDEIARAGIGYVPEDRRIFVELTAAENLVVGAKPGNGGTKAWTAARVFELFPEVARRRDAPAGTLSGGERQMLAVGRALMGNPRLLLLDEPSEGLAPVVIHRLGDALSELRRDGIALLVSEQNRALAARLAESVVILESGQVRYTGTFADLKRNPDIIDRYLGV